MLTPAEIGNVLQVDLISPLLLARLMLPGMLERRYGRIINISSLAGHTSFPYTEWLPGTLIVSLPTGSAMLRSRSELMLWSRVATRTRLSSDARRPGRSAALAAPEGGLPPRPGQPVSNGFRHSGGEPAGESSPPPGGKAAVAAEWAN